jgi:hypothetical protein
MKTPARLMLAVLALPLSIGPSYASTPQQHQAMKAGIASRGAAEEEEQGELGPASTSEKQGYGCLIAGGAGLAAAGIAGSSDVVLLFTGATTLPATTPLGLSLAVAGTVVASTCAVGALLAPTTLRLWHYYYDGQKIRDRP